MDTQNVQQEEAESDTVTYLRRGTLDILDAVAVQLPDVFYGEILPKLDVHDTLNLAQVNKAYNAAVWSADGVRSLEAKIEAHLVKIGEDWTPQPLSGRQSTATCPRSGPSWSPGMDVNKVLTRDNMTALHVAACHGHAAVVKALIEAGADVNKPASPHTVTRVEGTGVLHNVTPVYFAAQKATRTSSWSS